MATVAKTSRTSTSTLGASSAGPFLLGFRLFDDDGLEVYVDQVRRADWTLTASYTSGYSDAAYITFDAALDTGSVLTITSALDPWREEDYVNGDPNLVAKMNVELARVWSVLRDHEEKHRRSVKLFNEEDPIPDGVSSLFGFDASGGLTSVPLANVVAQAILLGGDLSDVVAGVSLPRTAPNATMLATTLINGQVALMDGLAYLKDDSATGVASSTNDLAVNGLVPFIFAASQHFGMAIDGVTDDQTKMQALSAADAIQVIPNGDYSIGGTMTAQARPKIVLADNATVAGQLRPFISISKYAPDALPKASLFVEQDTAHRDDTHTAYFQRVVNTDDLITNPKNVRSRTVINFGTTGAEWAISGELVSYSNVATAGHVATSGVADKYGTAPVFGGHFQAKDWNKFSAATAVTALLGMEVNTPAVGRDHPTSNDGDGLRHCIEVVARTNESVAGWDTATDNYGDAEIGVGVLVRTDGLTSGYFRTGIVIKETAGNSNAMSVGMRVKTSGAYGIRTHGSNTTAHLYSDGTPANGAVFNGTYSGSAVRIATGQALAFDSANQIKMSYTNPLVTLSNAGTERIGFDMTATPRIRIAGTAILGARKTGWTVATGTATRTAFDTASVTLPQLAERVKALIDDLHATAGHGLIGA